MTSDAAPFPLTRYFLVTGLVTAVVVGAVLAGISAREVERDLLGERQDFAVLIARHLNRQVYERFLRPTLERDGYVDLDGPHLEALDAVVRSSIAEFGIHIVYFFDPNGRIEYSTNLAHRGFLIRENPHLARALAGAPSSNLVARDSPLDLGGRAGTVPLLETYVPVYSIGKDGKPEQGPPRGVIEIYQDASDLLADTRRATLRTVAIATLGVLALMLALWLWIRKAERTIEERTLALLDANARLAALSADLERQVEDRTKRLLRAETLASVGTLSAGVAHEVNNPVASIASCAEGLLRRARNSESLRGHPDFADFPEYLEIIRSEAFRVKEITRNLLDFSRRGNAGRREPVDLAALLRATERLLAHRLEKQRKRLVLRLPEGRASVQGDGAGLRQVVLNLSVNAMDAAREEVVWSLERTEGGVRLVCEDDGPGFDEDALAHALEPFYTQKGTGEGTGLGLSIAYGIVRDHGGRLEVANRVQGGARVTVDLPAHPPAQPDGEGTAGGSAAQQVPTPCEEAPTAGEDDTAEPPPATVAPAPPGAAAEPHPTSSPEVRP
ncbi:MAG: hypothetical protein D6731_24425 [Planctomycetota bacterium]|nr:MAG: hypothetical protein D6731_24425 [Planctomycetota bacterium]